MPCWNAIPAPLRCIRYARVGRLLAGLDGTATDSDARLRLIDLLEAWVTALDIPRLATLGMTGSDMTPVLAGVSSNSMRTNPVSLTDDELAEILRS